MGRPGGERGGPWSHLKEAGPHPKGNGEPWRDLEVSLWPPCREWTREAEPGDRSELRN